jgi:fucose permease
VLTLNALLGLGTALAPVFVAIFVGLGFWWGLPILVGGCVVGLLVWSARLPLRAEAGGSTSARTHVPPRFWLFAAFALLYGVAETMNGNWAQVDMTQHVGATATMASLALTAFWAMVTVGRILFASIEDTFPTSRTYHLLPFVLAAAFVAIAALPDDVPGVGIVVFAIAGLGCSALLPLTISFGQEQLPAVSAVAGGVIAFYQMGYGIAALGTGPLVDAGVALPAIFGASAVVALVMGALSFRVTATRRAPTRAVTTG